MKLYELPRDKGIKIYGDYEVTDNPGAVIVFHHIDGMYSYCTIIQANGDPVLEKDGRQAITHLNASTEIEPHKDGYRMVAS